MSQDGSFRAEVEISNDDQFGNKVTKIKCHGKLVSATVDEMKAQVQPLIPLGGRIELDLSDLNYLDSSGLGALVGLKVSAVRQGLCVLEFVNLTPRVLELLRLTHLTQLFSS
jgi:anti-anti-sigma factor